MGRWIWVPWLALAACDEDGDGVIDLDLGDPQEWIDPVEYHLAATTTAAWMGMITLAHLDGGHACAAEDPDDAARLILTPGPACPHALLEGLDGTASVQLPDPKALTTSASAADLHVGGRPLLASEYGMLQLAPTGDIVTMVISTSDYGDETVWGWVTRVHTAGTPELTDDTVELSSATFAAEHLPEDYEPGANEVSMLSTYSMTPDCRRNPTLGSMILEGHSNWPLLDVLAPAACEGKLRIDSTSQESEWTPDLDLLAGQ